MPKLYDDMVKHMKKQKGVDNPYALATFILQKSGDMKKGTRELTAKGKRKKKKG